MAVDLAEHEKISRGSCHPHSDPEKSHPDKGSTGKFSLVRDRIEKACALGCSAFRIEHGKNFKTRGLIGTSVLQLETKFPRRMMMRHLLNGEISFLPRPRRESSVRFGIVALIVSVAVIATFDWPTFFSDVRPHGDRKERVSGRDFLRQTDVQPRPEISASAPGWDGERAWSGLRRLGTVCRCRSLFRLCLSDGDSF